MSGKPKSVESGVVFYPRGGSAQVVRYLMRTMQRRGWEVGVHAGSLGPPAAASNAASFYDGLPLNAFGYDQAQAEFEAGRPPMAQALARPFHPSYEDRGSCPDVMFGETSPATAAHLAATWRAHLAASAWEPADVLHLHHLSHLQEAAQHARAAPRLTTLHGTELKLIRGMARRTELAARVGHSPRRLAELLAAAGPGRQAAVERLAVGARLGEEDFALLSSTRWRHWQHADFWVRRLRAAVRHAGVLVAVSEHDREEASELLPLEGREVRVIANGVDTAHFCPQDLDERTRTAWLRTWLVADPQGWLPGGGAGSIRYTEQDLARFRAPGGGMRPVLLWCGRFLAFKRVPVLLDAFARIRTRLDPPPVLVMWGGYPGEFEGAHPVDLVHGLGLEDDVFFVGWRGHGELPTGLACADLMVAPAVDEPFGMVYVEAMAAGNPPVATATGGPARIITPAGDAADGWTVAPDDPAGLADTLVAALSDDAERLRRGRRGTATARERYGWDRVADAYTEIYEEAAGRKPPG